VTELAGDIQKRDHGGSVITVANFYDKDGDKFLSRDEFAGMLGSLGFEVPEALCSRLFESFDENKDGKVEYFEFIRTINTAQVLHREIKAKFPPQAGLHVFVGKNNPYSWRVTLALEELGVFYQIVTLDPSKHEHETADYLSLNPRAETPSLVDCGLIVHESAAILTYLANTCRGKSRGEEGEASSKEISLSPVATDKIKYSKFLTRFHEVAHLEKLVDLTQELTNKEDWRDEKAAIRGLKEQLEAELRRWDNYLGDDGPKFVVGSSVSIVDLALFPLLVTLATYNLDLTLYPHLDGYYKAFSRRPSVEKTWPSALKGVTHSVFA